MEMKDLVAQLAAEKDRIRQMGGEAKIEKQHGRGKLTARERLALLFDDGAFFEVGILGTQMGPWGKDKPAADAVVCGIGEVDGRMVASAAYDFTVKGGSIGHVGEIKVARLRELALRCRMPMVWFIDSAGARIDPMGQDPDMISTFAGTGYLFQEEVVMSGVVPLVSAMVGPGAAGTAYIPGLADFVPMVKKIGSMALAGPPLVKAVTGETVSEQELGGSKVHTTLSGVGDVQVKDDAACVAMIKDYLSYMPSHCKEKPPIIPCDDPVDRADDELLNIVPPEQRKPYDMYKILERVVDHGTYLDIKPKWAKPIITCLARIGGYPCGIVANNPRQTGGVLDGDCADKAAHFMQICDAFNIPLVFFQDVPGFMVGQRVEHAGIIRHGAKMLHVMASATVPKLTVVVRKAYGAGYYVMCGRAYEPDLLVGWPGSEISVMGAEGMVGIAGPKIFGGKEPAPEVKAGLVQAIQGNISIDKSAAWGYVDDVIDPRDTRKVLAQGLRWSWNKEMERPWRKRGVMPV